VHRIRNARTIECAFYREIPAAILSQIIDTMH
jgi:hypothetical protein